LLDIICLGIKIAYTYSSKLKKEQIMKKKMIFLITGLSLAVVSAIALPAYPDRTSILHLAFNSLWKAIKAGIRGSIVCKLFGFSAS